MREKSVVARIFDGKARTFRGDTAMSSAGYSDNIIGIIQREYSPLKHAAEILARHARTSTRTAENYLSGRNAPKAEQLITLMANCDALANEVNRLVAAAKERRQTK